MGPGNAGWPASRASNVVISCVLSCVLGRPLLMPGRLLLGRWGCISFFVCSCPSSKCLLRQSFALSIVGLSAQSQLLFDILLNLVGCELLYCGQCSIQHFRVQQLRNKADEAREEAVKSRKTTIYRTDAPDNRNVATPQAESLRGHASKAPVACEHPTSSVICRLRGATIWHAVCTMWLPLARWSLVVV